MMMANGKDGLGLDPELWEELPDDLLQSVIAKLPFSRVVAFRTVCKRWYSDIIPIAAAHLEAESPSVILYLSHHTNSMDYFSYQYYDLDDLDTIERAYHEGECKGYVWWKQISNVETEWHNGFDDHSRPKCFPALRNGEDVQLLICERGLFFFGLTCRDDNMLQDVVVCNPLMSLSKSLTLPRPLERISVSPWKHHNILLVDVSNPSDRRYLLTGVTFDSTTGSYCFVCAGVEGTYVYDSITSVWTICASFLSALREVGGWSISYDRSVSCNGNLYWYTDILQVDRTMTKYVIQFDVQHTTWNLFPDESVNCIYSRESNNLWISDLCIASYKGDMLLWHLHEPLRDDNDPPELLSLDQVDGSLPQYMEWPCWGDPPLELNADVTMRRMPHCMMTKIYMFLVENVEDLSFCNYSSFSQGNSIYHVACTLYGFIILVQDTDENSYTALPCMPAKRLLGEQYPYPGNIWSFSPSLTSVP